jgi:hypothetical protein
MQMSDVDTGMTVRYRGHDYPVYLSGPHFTVTINGHRLAASKFYDLHPMVEKIPRKVVDVAFIKVEGRGSMDGPVIRRGHSTGYHATTGALLVQWEDKESKNPAQVYEAQLHRTMAPLAGRTLSQLGDLLAAEREAAQAVDDFIGAHGYDVVAATDRALEADDGQ